MVSMSVVGRMAVTVSMGMSSPPGGPTLSLLLSPPCGLGPAPGLASLLGGELHLVVVEFPSEENHFQSDFSLFNDTLSQCETLHAKHEGEEWWRQAGAELSNPQSVCEGLYAR